jgi:hypothetical protein
MRPAAPASAMSISTHHPVFHIGESADAGDD